MNIPAGLGEALLYSASDAIIATDREGRVTFWNPGADRIFGFTAAETEGQSLDLIIPETCAPGTGRAFGTRWRRERAVTATAICCRCPA